jgi:predicted MPP superfamily phosphohydrolase
MRVAILHLSDLHIKNTCITSKAKTAAIASALVGLNENFELVVVAFSGDIAYAGTPLQYEMALEYVADLTACIKERFNNIEVVFVATPGNHDCDFSSSQNQSREMLISGLLRAPKTALELDTLSQCYTHQTNFFAFLDSVETVRPVESQGRFYYRYEIERSDRRISISCFNTALSSKIKEVAGSLYFPVENLKQIKALTADYNITIFHHPYNWLTPEAKNQFQSFNENRSDLVLTGHEHVAAHYRKSNYASKSSAYIEGAVLAETDESTESAFNVIVVNLASSEELICEFSWGGELFNKNEISGGWRPYRRALKFRDFELSAAMQDFITGVGMPFTHPAKPVLTIDDIFIAPDAEEFIIQSSKNISKSGVIKGKNLIPTIIDRKRAFIIGRERAGKSTLSKLLFSNYYSIGLTPILIEGGSLKRSDLDDLPRLVRRYVSSHYENPKLELFDQYDKDKIVIIVDDLDHAIELGPKGRTKFLENLHNNYQRVVVFGDDLLRIEEMASGQFASESLQSFSHLELKEFGYVLRSQLIDKWYAINAEYTTDEEALSKKVREAEHLIDDMMRRSYLPSYPLFILTILQGVGGTQNLDSHAGSYGYLYQVLITDKLANFSKSISLERKLGYLVELAYYMFKRRHSELSDAEYDVFHLKYCVEYPSIDRSLIFLALEAAGILELYDSQYRFKYKYFYYYFVAQYFGRHIDNALIKEEIKALCKDFDKEEHANIWLFLTHQSRSQFLLDSVIEYAHAFFSDLEPLAFGGDVEFLDKLYEKVPALVYIEKSIEEIRQERRERLDREGSRDGETLPVEDGAADIVELAKNIKAAIRTLEVIGQVVKNFATLMKSDPRYILVKECYDLGLRVIARCVKMWQEAGDEFVGDILDVILHKETNLETKAELERAIKGFIFYFCETITVNMVKRVAQAVGSRDLVGTYAELYDKNPNRSYQMIDIALKLDNPSFPAGDVYSLNETLGKEIFCKRILSRLVVGHFYLYKTKDQLKQQVCSKLGIEMQKFKEIDFKTQESKRLN